MEKIQIQVESPNSSRGLFGRPLVLIAISAVMITSVFAVLFYTSNSVVEFGQSITPVQSCAYAQGAGSIVLTPSSTYMPNFSNYTPGFALTGLTESLQSGYQGCQDKVLATMFLDSSNNPITLVTYNGAALTTFQVYNAATGSQNSNVNIGYADLIAHNDVGLCTTDGQTCYNLTTLTDYGTFSASNLGQSAGGDSVSLGFTLSSPVDATAVQQVVMQTLGGFTSPLQ